MANYEYRLVKMWDTGAWTDVPKRPSSEKARDIPDHDHIDELGADGWELVTVLSRTGQRAAANATQLQTFPAFQIVIFRKLKHE